MVAVARDVASFVADPMKRVRRARRLPLLQVADMRQRVPPRLRPHGCRTVMEYLLSPESTTPQEAGRER